MVSRVHRPHRTLEALQGVPLLIDDGRADRPRRRVGRVLEVAPHLGLDVIRGLGAVEQGAITARADSSTGPRACAS